MTAYFSGASEPAKEWTQVAGKKTRAPSAKTGSSAASAGLWASTGGYSALADDEPEDQPGTPGDVDNHSTRKGFGPDG